MEKKSISLLKKIKDSRYYIQGIYALIIVCLSILFYFSLKNFPIITNFIGKIVSILAPFILGFIVAFLLNPILLFLEKELGRFIKNKKILRSISVVVAYLMFFLVIAMIIGIVLPQFINSARELVQILVVKVNEISNQGISFINSPALDDILTDNFVTEITKYVKEAMQTLYQLFQKIISQLLTITGSITSTIFTILMSFIVSFYLLSGKEKFLAQFKKIIFSIFNKSTVKSLTSFGQLSHKTFNKFIIGQLLDALIVGILCFILLLFFRFPYALLISVLVGVTNIIPYFGPFIGAIPSALILLAVSPKHTLGFIILIIILQQIDGNIISPKILGDSTGLSGLWILFAVSTGGDLFGIPGMILAVPIFAIMYAGVTYSINKRLSKKGLSDGTIDYDNSVDEIFKSINDN